MGWDADRAKLARAVSGYFDTARCTATGMRKAGPNADYEVDPARVGFTFFGTIDLSPEMTPATDANRPRPSDRNIRLVSRVCLTALTTHWPWQLRQGDRVACAGVLYQVAAAPERDGSDRVAIWLNRLAG